MSAQFKWDQKKWKEFVRKVEKNVNRDTIDKVLAGVAFTGQREFVAVMPKVTGELARSWHTIKRGTAQYEITSNSKVALFLEEGTKAHGPKTAKYLYIPLRPGARVWRRGLVFGRDYVLTKRVRGIKALKYLRPVSDSLSKVMVDEFVKQLQKIGA
jgi:hypothetical protein